ncbi:hypothetical protein L6452_34374 [Arctium lappa]|uniref:Uncharacterized protein n=1 Tax=Arctium lappa TaxID=4217 RepID=A0ACB8YJ85_ARCLA|nr:hypothetical protein L6452_34374 [Arctium lappa]
MKKNTFSNFTNTTANPLDEDDNEINPALQSKPKMKRIMVKRETEIGKNTAMADGPITDTIMADVANPQQDPTCENIATRSGLRRNDKIHDDRMNTEHETVAPKVNKRELLYVETTNWPEIKVEHKRPAILAWSCNLLKKRELFEIEEAGLGSATLSLKDLIMEREVYTVSLYNVNDERKGNEEMGISEMMDGEPHDKPSRIDKGKGICMEDDDTLKK